VFVLHSSFEEPEISKKTFQISSCFLATIWDLSARLGRIWDFYKNLP
jgi:hypothetical protein